MALGYCEAVVLHLATINENYNGTKVTQPGFLNMLLQTPNAPEIVAAYGEGHRREVRVKYKTIVFTDRIIYITQLILNHRKRKLTQYFHLN